MKYSPAYIDHEFDVTAVKMPNAARFRGVVERLRSAGIELTEEKLHQLQAIAVCQPHKDKVVVITGGANGIGFAAATIFAIGGAKAVAVLDFDRNVAADFQNHNDDGLYGYRCDVTKVDEIEAALTAFRQQHGIVDTLVLNAGRFLRERKTIHDMDPQAFRDSIEVNLIGTFNVAQACSKDLAEAGRRFKALRESQLPEGETLPSKDSGLAFTDRGLALLNRVERRPSVLIVGSRNVHAFSHDAGEYNIPKAAVTQLGRDIAVTLGADGVNVNVLHPDGVYVASKLWTREALEARLPPGKSLEDTLRTGWLRADITAFDVGLVIGDLCGPSFSSTTGHQVTMDGGDPRTCRL